MTAVSLVGKPVSMIRLAPGSVVTIEDVSWEEFESILPDLGEKRSLRVADSNSTLEIMVTLPEREKLKTLNLIVCDRLHQPDRRLSIGN